MAGPCRKLLKSVYKDLIKCPVDNVTIALVDENIFHWDVTVIGPAGSDYEDGVFHVSVKFSRGFPFSPPQVKMTTPIYHLNIDNQGNIALEKLQCWTKDCTMEEVFTDLVELLQDPIHDKAINQELAV